MYYISISSWGSVDPFVKSKAEEARTVIKPDKNNRVRGEKSQEASLPATSVKGEIYPYLFIWFGSETEESINDFFDTKQTIPTTHSQWGRFKYNPCIDLWKAGPKQTRYLFGEKRKRFKPPKNTKTGALSPVIGEKCQLRLVK